MARLGSDGGFQADNRGGIIDDQGNTVVSSSTSFGDAPLGYGPLTQVTTGFPNGLMSLPPQDASAPIVDNANEMPGWSVQELSDGRIITEWIELSPAQSLNIKSAIDAARSSVIGGSGPSGGTATTYSGRGALQITLADADIGDQLVLSAEAPYVSAIGAGITTAFVMSFEGTTTVIAGVEIVQEIYAVDDDGDETIIYYNSAVAGDNTSGWGFKKVIPDTTTKLTATITIDIVGAVVSSAPLLISSVTASPADGDALRSSLITAPGDLIAGYEVSSIAGTYTDVTSIPIGTAGQVLTVDLTEDARMKWATPSGGGGGGSVIVETFTASGTWTRPAGVEYLVAVVGLGAGGGGGGGQLTCRTTSLGTAAGNHGGGGGAYGIIRDLYVGGVASISVGIGAAGIGGTANTFTKPAFPNAGSANTSAQSLVSGGDGGATTFGTFLTINGGQGGGRDAGQAESTVFDFSTSTAGLGAASTSGSGGTVGNPGGSAAMAAFSQLSYLPEGTAAGAAGSAGSVSITGAGSAIGASSGAAGGAAGYGGGGGGGGKSTHSITYAGGAGGAKGAGGGGGAAGFQPLTTGGTAVVKGGDGGNAATRAGAGGGGGAGATAYGSQTPYNLTDITITSGKGGDGSAGVIYVVYLG